jgi:flavin-dependent dehydrogenase
VVGNYFRLKKTYPHLNKMALYAHYRNVFREEGEKGTLTRMVRLPDRWFWMIPLDADRTSVGVVMDTETFRESKMKPEEALEQSWRSNPVMYERMKDSERVTQVYSSGDYSYRVANMTGDQWMLAGDAAGFIDPIFSSGVFLAIYSGENAAEALHRILDHPADRQKLFRHYERDLNRVMDLYLRFVNAWYRKEFVEVFLNPTETLQLAPAVNALLAGNTGRNWQLAWRLKLFEFFVWAQRFVPLSPRLALTR